MRDLPRMQPLVQRLPVLQQTVRIPVTQGRLDAMVRGDDHQGFLHPPGLIFQIRSQFPDNGGVQFGNMIIQIDPVLQAENHPGPCDKQRQQHDHWRQQEAQHRLGRGMSAPGKVLGCCRLWNTTHR